MGRSLHVFLQLPLFFHDWKSVFVLHSGWEEEIHGLGVYRAHFFPCRAHKCFLKSNFLSKGWFPIYHFVFGFPRLLRPMETPSWASHNQNVFLHTQHLCFVVMCILVLVWTVSENQESKRTKIGLINLVKRGTSQKIKMGWLLFYAHLGEH